MNIDKFQDKIDEYETQFYLVLENFKTSYANYKTVPTPENQRQYLKYKSNLENLYSELFLLGNDIETASTNMKDRSSQTNLRLKNDKQKYVALMEKVNKIENIDLAAKPRYLDYVYDLRVQQSQLFLLVFGLGGFGYVFYKHLTKTN